VLLRVETKTDEAIVHRKSGQSLAGRGMHDFRVVPGLEGWFAGQIEGGALFVPTKSMLARCEPELDLSRYDNPPGEPEPVEEVAELPDLEEV
jgi:hypothetical protein